MQVYVGQSRGNRKHYHTRRCHVFPAGARKVSKETAEGMGLDECGRCKDPNGGGGDHANKSYVNALRDAAGDV